MKQVLKNFISRVIDGKKRTNCEQDYYTERIYYDGKRTQRIDVMRDLLLKGYSVEEVRSLCNDKRKGK